MNSKGKAIKKMTMVEIVRMKHPERFLSKAEQSARARAISNHMARAKEPTDHEKKVYQSRIGRAYSD